jgi:hypothetical protein
MFKSNLSLLVSLPVYIAGPTLPTHPILLPPSVNLPVNEQSHCPGQVKACHVRGGACAVHQEAD